MRLTNNEQWLQNYLSGLSEQRYEETLDKLESLADEITEQHYKEFIRDDAIQALRDAVDDSNTDN